MPSIRDPDSARGRLRREPRGGEPAATRAELVTTLFAELVEIVAGRVAARVIDYLRASDIPGYVDQTTSPLGRRRHIAAIRSGALPGVRVGRRYVAREEDVARYVAQESGEANTQNTVRRDRVDDLACELSLTDSGSRALRRSP